MTDDAPDELLPEDLDAPAAGDASASATREGVERQNERIKRERMEGEAFWRHALNEPIGRRELWRVIAGGDGAHAFETRFPGGPSGFPDPIAAWYQRGEQDFGLRLYQRWLLIDPQAVHRMHLENDPRFAAAPQRRRRVSHG